MAAKLMHAVLYDSYGGGPSDLKHVQVPIPTPKKNEVLLKLEAASLNPVTVRFRKAWRGLVSLAMTDVAGEVVEVGREVTKFKVGDKVVALLSYRDGGGLGEFAAAKENSIAFRPPEVSAADGAGLAVAALTAHQALTKDARIMLDGTNEQKNILITGASCNGQMRFLTTRPLKGQRAVKSPSGLKYDFVIHSSSKAIPWSVFEPNLSSNGKVIDLTANPSSIFTFVLKKITFSKKTLVPLIINGKGEKLDCLVELAKEGKLKTVIDSTFPLSKAEDAWARRLDGCNTGRSLWSIS
ncbi:hypothetical protein ACLB2K_016207 [Fragaria x ananassa]